MATDRAGRRQCDVAQCIRQEWIRIELRTINKLLKRRKVGTCEASRFDSIRKSWADSKFSNRPCLPIARRSQTTQAINGA